jgi:hypothetical protein
MLAVRHPPGWPLSGKLGRGFAFDSGQPPEGGIWVASGEVVHGTQWLGGPIISHEAATLPATEAWNRADYGARHRYRRGRVRLLRGFGLAVLFRLMRKKARRREPAGCLA